jgi:hypothetical protein
MGRIIAQEIVSNIVVFLLLIVLKGDETCQECRMGPATCYLAATAAKRVRTLSVVYKNWGQRASYICAIPWVCFLFGLILLTRFELV